MVAVAPPARHRVDTAWNPRKPGPELFLHVCARPYGLSMTDDPDASSPAGEYPAAVARAREIFDPIAAEYLGRPGVDIGPMFGSEGLRIRGKVFAFISHRGTLVVKVPAERADDLEAARSGERMQIGGRTLREWVMLDVQHAEHWPGVTDEAFAYVDVVTP